MTFILDPVTVILDKDTPLETFAGQGGGKAMNLAHLSRAGLAVPPWFCLAAGAFDLFVEANGLADHLHPEANLHRLGDFARDVESLFLQCPVPAPVTTEVNAALMRLDLQDQLLAVRSSGIDEDSAGHSFAGQFSSFLCQRGATAVFESIRRCWASGFSERAIAYRVERGLRVSGIRIGVVIQAMIEPVAAGVAFSRNPVHPLDRQHLVIESVYGLGEGLVSGELDADHFAVARDSLAIETTAIADKSTALRYGAGGGVTREPLPEALRRQPSLTAEQVRAIGSLVLQLERDRGLPQDSEWVIDRAGQLFVVQTRPVTTLPADAFFDAGINGDEVILWDNSNIVESYSGVTTPLTFSFANAAYYRVYVQFCQVMGVPRRAIADHEVMYRNMLGLVRGQVYYNLINWYRLIQLLPLAGRSGGFMETMMGVKQTLQPELASLFEFINHPPRYSLPRRLWVSLLSAWRFLRIDAIVADFFRHFDRIYDSARRQDFPGMSLPDLADYYRLLDRQVLGNWRAPIINDYICMICFGLLQQLTRRWVAAGDEATSLQNDLLCGQGGLESTRPTRLLMETAAWVHCQDEARKHWFDQTPGAEVWRQLTEEDAWPELRQRLDAYLDQYGFRCVNELKLEEKDLHEDPSFIVNAIRSYVRAGTFDIAALEAREAAISDNALEQVDRALRGPHRWLYYRVLRQARKAVRHRENLRFARTRIFGIARRIFLAMGLQLQRLGLIDDERDVFLLTVEDILGFIEGRPTTVDLAGLVALRKREFDDYRRGPAPPERLLTRGAAGPSFALPQVLADADLLRSPAAADDDLLRGTPCCPGVVEGVVRVAETSRDAEGMAGEILVTARTDPGWVPLYPSCAGLLIERGSLLSHSAVVARELGLPTIVGISGGLMQRLRSGQRVRMDAGRGEVRILS